MLAATGAPWANLGATDKSSMPSLSVQGDQRLRSVAQGTTSTPSVPAEVQGLGGIRMGEGVEGRVGMTAVAVKTSYSHRGYHSSH